MEIRVPDADAQEEPGSDRVTLPDKTHAKHKPVLHIGENGHMASEDDLEISSESLPTLGTDGTDGTRQTD
jgi:hypothetical protein